MPCLSRFRSITRPKRVAEDVFVKVGKFHFPIDFVVVDFKADPRVPLILGRSFLRTGRALIDVYREEITLRYNPKSSNSTLVSDPLISESDFNKLPVIIAKDLKDVEKEAFIKVLKSHKRAIVWKISDIKGIDPRFCTHKILMEEDYKPAVQSQRKVNPKIHDVIKKEVIKLLDVGIIYPISNNAWVSPIYCVPKKGGMTIVANENNELILKRLVTGWRVYIDYRKLNDATRKDHFSLPFMDQMLERLARNEFYCFLDGFLGCMIAIFHDMIKKTMEVFMDDFSVFGDSFSSCLTNLDKMLKRCEETNLVLNWEKCHFMCKEGIVLGHTILKSRIEVDSAKVDVIAKLPHPTAVNGVRSFLGHAGFYRCFIQDFSKIARPMPHLLEKDTPFVFFKECVDAFNTLKKKITEAPILVVPEWNLPFELMIPRAIISDRVTHFCNDQFTRVMIKYGVTHRLATAYHPPTRGQVEVSNRGLKRILERMVGENHTSWAYWALKHVNFNLKTTGDHQKLQPNELNELHDQAYENFVIYKERTKKLYDSKIKNRIFNVGDQVLLFNSRLKILSGKLKTHWPGPFTITHVFPYGTVELSQPIGPNFKVNGHRVKHYFRGNIPSNVVLNLHTFPMDK
nr:retrovirus-related Pol polyprotein from transposon 17.6 [Tanacetum cinerariifolium]